MGISSYVWNKYWRKFIFFSVHGPSRDSDPVCLGCYRFLTSLDDDELLCSFGCSIALCDSCNASAILEGPVEQHLPECQSFRALQSEKLHKLLINPPLLYEVILVLRYKKGFHPPRCRPKKLNEKKGPVGLWQCRENVLSALLLNAEPARAVVGKQKKIQGKCQNG